MSSTWYLKKLVLSNGTWLLDVPSDPNGLVAAPLGSLALAADGTGPWKNTGGMAWSDVSAGGSGAGSTFVFRPGGVTAGNVYATWPALYAALSAVEGTRFLLFDNSIVSPCPIPAGGPYDLSDVIAFGLSNPGAGLTEAKFLDNALVSEFFEKFYGILFSTEATTVATCTLGAGIHIVDAEAGNLTTALGATKPFFAVTGAGAILALTLHQSSIQTGVTPSIRTTGGATTTLNLFDSSSLEATTIEDDGVSATTVSFDASSSASTTQPGATTPPTYTAVDDATRVNYTPSVPTDYAPAPGTNGTTARVQTALDQIVRNGAGHFQKARDPLLAAPAVWIDTAGSDSTGDGSNVNPFATVARAIQSMPSLPEYNGSYGSINVKTAGTYYVPQDADFGILDVFGTAPTIANTYTVHATQPANTAATGSRIVLDTLALAATVPPGTRLNVTVGVTPYFCEVYRSDNSGAGGRLVLWVIANDGVTNNKTVITPAVGASVDILTMGTSFAVDNFTVIKGGFFNDIRFVGNAGATFFSADGSEFFLCNIDLTLYNVGAGCSFTQPYIGDVLYSSAPLTATVGGVWRSTTDGGCLRQGNGGGSADLQDEHAFINDSGMFNIAVRSGAGDILGGINAIWRMVANIDIPFVANETAYGARGIGGGFALGDILQPQDLAGAQIVGVTGTVLVHVGALTGCYVKLGASSSVTIGGVLNPVEIGAVAVSSDVSGTRIFGGTPKPGPDGFTLRTVTVASSALDPDTDQTIAVQTSLGVPVIDIPLPDVTLVTPGAPFTVNWEIGAGVAGQDVTLTPFLGQKVQNLAAAYGFTANVMRSVDLIASPSSSNWLVA